MTPVNGCVPWSDQMRRCEDDTQNDTDTSNGNICDSKERVSASHNRACGYDDGLGTSIDVDWEI